MAPRPPTEPSSKPTHALSSRPSSLDNPYKTPHKTNNPSTKRQKRISKHETLLSRITKSVPKSKVTKRRRPSKKLVTSLDSLADALPGSTGNGDDDDAWEGIDDGKDGVNIKHKSLKSRPGAGKKKEKLLTMERERFARNLAEMSAGSASQNATADGGMIVEGEEGDGTKSGSADRWAAIRGFISQTMERRPEGEAVVGKK